MVVRYAWRGDLTGAAADPATGAFSHCEAGHGGRFAELGCSASLAPSFDRPVKPETDASEERVL